MSFAKHAHKQCVVLFCRPDQRSLVHFIKLEYKQRVHMQHPVDRLKITGLDMPHEGSRYFTAFKGLFGENRELAEELCADFHFLS